MSHDQFFDEALVYNFSYELPFERSVNEQAVYLWFKSNWTLSIWASLVYLVVIFILRRRLSVAYELRPALAVWSASLAVFSVLGTARTVPEMLHVWRVSGTEATLCVPTIFRGSVRFWTVAFALSKLVELGDTVFIVLRKRPLIFLHWYHHVTVLMFTWYSYPERVAPGRWFMTLNFAVHSLMYTYYAARAARLPLRRGIAQLITLAQLAQMVVGLVVCAAAVNARLAGRRCSISQTSAILGFLMYGSYLLLFAQFYYNSYLRGGQRRKSVSADTKNKIDYANGNSHIVHSAADSNQNHLTKRIPGSKKLI